MCSTVGQDGGCETALEAQFGAPGPSGPMSLEQDQSSECALSQDVKSGLCPGDGEAAGDFFQVPHPLGEEQSHESCTSVGSQGKESGSSYGSSSERPEEQQNPEHRSGTEHTELSQVPHPAELNQRDSICESEMRPRKDEAAVEIPEDALGAQDGSATRGTGLPQLPDPAGHRQGEAASLLGQSESQPRNGIGEEWQDGSAMGVTHRKSLRRYLAPVEWIRSHPMLTLAVLTLLLLLAVALAVSLAAVSGRRQTNASVSPVTPVTSDTLVTSDTPRLLACPHGWVGYNGICYFLSKDHLSWNQAKARCSELEASLAMLTDTEMEFLFERSGNVDYWLGLHRQDQWLQWVDGSNFSSSVPVLGNADCVHLAENCLRRQPCSNDMQYICSRPQTHL